MQNDITEVQVLVLELSNTQLVLKSKDGKTPLFKNSLSAVGFKQYLESKEGGSYQVDIMSELAVILSHNTACTDENSIQSLFANIHQNVRMPHEAAITQGIFTYEEMFLFWNMHEIYDRLDYIYM